MTKTIKQDQSVFGPRSYYVDSYPNFKFSSEKDVENALRLAHLIKLQTINKVRKELDIIILSTSLGD